MLQKEPRQRNIEEGARMLKKVIEEAYRQRNRISINNKRDCKPLEAKKILVTEVIWVVVLCLVVTRSDYVMLLLCYALVEIEGGCTLFN
jgi:hypothetical protein